MKTLILNGSPRKQGDTAKLISLAKKDLQGDVMEIETYTCNISPCIDCRYCWDNNGCAINDEMQAVYEFIQECDNILIASPIYFSELTGRLLDFSSRLQTFFASRYFRKEEPISKSKKGAVILVGGSDGRMDKAFETATTILHHLRCDNIHDLVFSHNTNQVPAVKDKQACKGVHDIVTFFNCSM